MGLGLGGARARLGLGFGFGLGSEAERRLGAESAVSALHPTCTTSRVRRAPAARHGRAEFVERR